MKKTEELKKQLEEKENRLLRALADLDNLKKRTAQEREEIVKFSNETLITALLPIIDNLDRAISAEQKTADVQEFLKGVALIHKQIEDIFVRVGVKPLEALGKEFDPNFHEAIMGKESDKPENTVIEEVQKGYTMHGKVIRPSMVIVAKENTKEEENG